MNFRLSFTCSPPRGRGGNPLCLAQLTSVPTRSPTGLFTAQDFVLANEVSEYNESREDLMDDIEPEGVLEQTYADEIMGAQWRLRRCRILEAALAAQATEGDSLDDAAIEKRQKSIE